jgi:hypothetical protein
MKERLITGPLRARFVAIGAVSRPECSVSQRSARSFGSPNGKALVIRTDGQCG